MATRTKKRTSSKRTSSKRTSSKPADNTAGNGGKVYQVVTDKIVALLEAGTVPWRRPWTRGAATGEACNALSGRPYRGINALMLSRLVTGYADPRWLTYRQATELGGHVRKGERSQLAVFWKIHERENAQSGDIDRFPVARWYYVFNVEQCEGLEADRLKTRERGPVFEPIEACERIVNGQPWPQCPIVHGGDRACYSPSMDQIRMPEPAAFCSPEHYYSVLFHEMTHSTGHERRLNRPDLMSVQPFGSPDYSREELVAEIGSAFLCAAAGIDCPALDENAAAYLASWLRVLRADNTLVMRAAGQAQRAADWILRVDAAAGADDAGNAEAAAEAA